MLGPRIAPPRVTAKGLNQHPGSSESPGRVDLAGRGYRVVGGALWRRGVAGPNADTLYAQKWVYGWS